MQGTPSAGEWTSDWRAIRLARFPGVSGVGILVFAVVPGLAKDSLAVAAGWGALFGLFTHATYELTNLATLRDWPLRVVIVDALWGVVLCALVASAGFVIGRWLRSGA